MMRHMGDIHAPPRSLPGHQGWVGRAWGGTLVTRGRGAPRWWDGSSGILVGLLIAIVGGIRRLVGIVANVRGRVEPEIQSAVALGMVVGCEHWLGSISGPRMAKSPVDESTCLPHTLKTSASCSSASRSGGGGASHSAIWANPTLVSLSLCTLQVILLYYRISSREGTLDDEG
jgi:hypothetical protein